MISDERLDEAGRKECEGIINAMGEHYDSMVLDAFIKGVNYVMEHPEQFELLTENERE